MTQTELLLIAINSIIIPLSGWTLYSVHQLTKGLAVESVYGQGHARDILEVRTRLVAVEAQVIELRIRTSHHHESR
jgi:hypothetical protein